MSRRTIQSPGVEIREIDLSQRPAAALGTSVFIAGFSNQGPTDEIFNVGTFSEFEEIYGKPTNAAERYFYHSTKQVFESDANVLVSRLPYGAGDGTSTEKYSALVYPVETADVSPITALNNNQIKFDTSSGNIGSGNIGATNALRTGNKLIGFSTLILDVLKAVIPVLYVKINFPDAVYISALCAFIGHVFPVWLKFKGGKGVATYVGILFSINLYIGVVFIGVWFLTFLISK